MATELGVAYISLLPEMKSFRPAAEKGMSKVGKGVATRFGVGFNGAIGSIVSRSAGIFAAGFATVKVGGFLKDAIAQASDLGETTSKVSQIFGPAAKDILKFSKTSATALGQTQQAALDANATFGIFGKSAGLHGKDLTGFTTKLTTLAGDLASFNNTTPEQAIEAIGAALRGETEPIRAYGVLLDDASLRQEALSQGLIKTTKQALTPQQKVLAAQALIMKQTTTAQGDFARTSGGLANQQRILSARFSDFKTTIGAVALPLATRFFGFMNSKGIPAIQGIASKVIEFTRSTSFRDFLAQVQVKATQLFGFLKDEALPRLRDFGGFIKDTAVPALKDMAGFVSKNKDFFVPFAGAILAVVAGLKVWAIIQGILNVVLAANPISLVIIAIAALAAGLVWAYRNSSQFRKVVDAAFKVVAAAGKFMWEAILKPLFGFMVATFKVVWERAQTWARLLAAAFNAIKGPAVAVFQFIVGQMLDFIGNMLNAAAKAFGWVPGIGPKLKNAAREFQTFKTSVNNALAGINDQTIKITPIVLAAQTNRRNNNERRIGATGYATGGGVFGGGTGTSDSIPAMLSNGEHVWTAREVRKAGGHAAVEQMRQTVLKYARGGAVGFDLDSHFPALAKPSQNIANTVQAVAKPLAQSLGNKLLATQGPGGPPGSVHSFRGKKLNSRTISMLLSAERILGAAFHITQGSYSTSVAASGGTHAGGGVMDTNGPRGWDLAVRALRSVGFAAWHRSPSQGPWGHHIHSVAIGDNSAAPSARRQVADYLRGGDGLGGMARGGRVTPKALSFDNGGLLPTGYSVVHNGTGSPEPVGHDFLRSSDLDGMRMELDAPGVGVLTGFIRLTAQGEINRSNRELKRRVGRN